MGNAFQTKSQKNYEAALNLFAAKNYNAAANRAWYAIYHAYVHCWEEKYGRKAKDVDGVVATNNYDPNEECVRWRHQFICDNSKMAPISDVQRNVIKAALTLRKKADYFPDPVMDEIEEVINEIPAILDILEKVKKR